jgi:acetylornithine deacetylase/succinyl-diaminopimelate desuccinylase-like protein
MRRTIPATVPWADRTFPPTPGGPGEFTAGPTRALSYAQSRQQNALAELIQFARFPSISADPGHAQDVVACARWLAARLRSAGLHRVNVIPTRGHPVVTGEWRNAPGRPTLLVYGHYDVQPPGPAAQWKTPPFTPLMRDGSLHGRGTADDKGPILAHVTAMESHLRATGRLPVNVVCVFEGEEEIGGPHLAAFLAGFAPARAADVAVVSDTPMRRAGVPTLMTGLRGELTARLRVRRPGRDLHAGHFGGAVPNPVEAACAIVAGLHDHSGRVTIPGFYDRVLPVTVGERARARKVAPTDAEILRAAGAPASWGERGFSLYERATMRPALVVNGIGGGGVSQAARAVVPAEAVVELNLRLVPRQRLEEVAGLLRAWLARTITQVVPPGIRVTMTFGQRVPPVLIPAGHPATAAAARALMSAFGTAPVLMRSGGSISAVASLNELGIPLVLMGYSLPSDRIHAANERFSLANFQAGIAASILFYMEMGRLDGDH